MNVESHYKIQSCPMKSTLNLLVGAGLVMLTGGVKINGIINLSNILRDIDWRANCVKVY